MNHDQSELTYLFDELMCQFVKFNTAHLVHTHKYLKHPVQPLFAGKDAKQHKTVSSAFRAQLEALLTTLNQTDPHFIRCIVPNNHKQPGVVDSRCGVCVLHFK